MVKFEIDNAIETLEGLFKEDPLDMEAIRYVIQSMYILNLELRNECSNRIVENKELYEENSELHSKIIECYQKIAKQYSEIANLRDELIKAQYAYDHKELQEDFD